MAIVYGQCQIRDPTACKMEPIWTNPFQPLTIVGKSYIL